MFHDDYFLQSLAIQLLPLLAFNRPLALLSHVVVALSVVNVHLHVHHLLQLFFHLLEQCQDVVHLEEGLLRKTIDLLVTASDRLQKHADGRVEVLFIPVAESVLVKPRHIVIVLHEYALFKLGQAHPLKFAQSSLAVVRYFAFKTFQFFLSMIFLIN